MERKLRINPTKNSNYLESQYKYWYMEAFSRNIECKINGPISWNKQTKNWDNWTELRKYFRYFTHIIQFQSNYWEHRTQNLCNYNWKYINRKMEKPQPKLVTNLTKKFFLKNLLFNLINWKFDDRIGIINLKLEKKLVQMH